MNNSQINTSNSKMKSNNSRYNPRSSYLKNNNSRSNYGYNNTSLTNNNRSHLINNVHSSEENVDPNSFIENQNFFRDDNYDNSSFDRDRPVIKRKKVLVLGAPGVGKSAVIMRFKDDIFKPDYVPTLQETYKKEFIFNNEHVELEIIDLDGQNEFTLFSGNKFSYGISGYIMCYSVENRYSFQMIKSINSKLESLVGDSTPKILIGNKADLSNKRVIGSDEGKNLAKEINATFLECSARSGLNIQLVFYSALVEINKMESNIDLKAFSCAWLIKHVLRNLNTNTVINYIFLILQIALDCLIVILAIYSQLYGGDIINSLVVGSLLLLGIFDLSFSILGIVGISSKRKDLINYYYIGLYISLVFLIAFLVSTLLIRGEICDQYNGEEENTNGEIIGCSVRKYIYLFVYTCVPTSFVIHLILLIYAYVLYKIYKNDLGNFII